MISRETLHKISDWVWEIPKSFRADMRVPARIYTGGRMMGEIFRDRSLNQLVNVASLPGIARYSLAMPDMHEGYGFPIGGVAAVRVSEGVISPGGVGYDINCGMRLLKSEYTAGELGKYLDALASMIQTEVPSGLGKGRRKKLDINFIDRVLEGGSAYLVKQGFGNDEDISNCEEEGEFGHAADSSAVSARAKNRGRDQVGTLGSGNHFCEIQKVEKIFDEVTASAFGIFEGQVVVMIHTGSRGLGHQIATDYIKTMMDVMAKYRIILPDRELACCPLDSLEGKRYFSAMACGANYAWANRQMIAYYIRKAWASVLGEKAHLRMLYDVSHNIAKIEGHEISGVKEELCVHRKGATRSFPPGRPEIPEQYRAVGQPVLIPGSMGTASYVMAGIKEGAESFWSTCHGAGRTMSRREAQRRISGQEVIKRLEQKGVIIKCHSLRGISEEAPLAYKDIDEVIEVVSKAGLSKKVAILKPLAVIKGE